MNLLDNDILIVLMLVIGAVATLGVPLMFYRRALREDNATLLSVQVERLSDEIMRLQVKVDEQQRKINDMNVEIANLRSVEKMLVDNMKRLAAQVKQKGDEPIVDVDMLMQILQS